MTWSVLAFAVLAGIIVFGAYKVVASPLVTHSALYLAMVLVGVAGVFLLLEAPFLAAVQVLVYAGAVMAVVIFAIMLSELQELGAGDRGIRGFFQELRAAVRSPYWGIVPVLLAALTLVLVLAAAGGLTGPEAAGLERADGSVVNLGRQLFTRYLVPFEVASAVLLVAMVGAIVLARDAKDGGGA